MTTYADTIFVGGSLFTAGDTASHPGALAVRGGRIAAIGTDAEVGDLRGPQTAVVDLAGGLLMPSFQDSHAHPAQGGAELLRCHLPEDADEAGCLARVAAFAAAHPGSEWITGAGWSMQAFPGGTPTAAALDSVVADRPVFLFNRDHHGAWVNSRALALAGIDASTPDPADGRIERDERGEPTGTLHEGAMNLVERLVPEATPEEEHAGLLEAQRVMFSLGVTSWQDAAVGTVFGSKDTLAVYLRAARSGELRARVVGALWWDRNRGSEQIPELLERRADAVVGSFRGTSVKIMQDGVAENYTAAMTEPYLDGCGCATHNTGLSFVDPIALREYVTRLDAEGFQVHFHSLGDRAVREALDAVEAAREANGPSAGRHHLAHLQVVHPDDVARFAHVGATANVQMLWAAHEPQMDELTIPFLGEPRSSWQYPFGDLLRSGARLAAGSDWPVSSPDPLDAVHVAVNRVAPGEDGDPFYAHNAVALADALAAYTAGTARVMHHEHETGALAEGLLADLVVLDRDPFAGAPSAIADTSVRRTYLGGDLVHTTDD